MNTDVETECSLSRLLSLAPHTLAQFTQRVIGTLSVSRRWLGRCLMALDYEDNAHQLGYSGAIHFAFMHGVDIRESREARRVGEESGGAAAAASGS